MIFSENDKQIYNAPTGKKYDPLSLQRKLIIASGGTLNNYLNTWVNDQSKEFDRAVAEDFLINVTRKAFTLPSFDEDNTVTDELVLKCLEDFLRWLEKNEKRG
jgi:hypothetical protein